MIKTNKKLENDNVLSALREEGIFVSQSFLDESSLNNLINEFDFLMNHNPAGTRFEQHPAGKCLRILLNKIDKQLIKQILQIFNSDVLCDIAESYLPRKSSINKDIVLTHEFKNTPITADHFDATHALKFLIYLQDTNEENGAFSYIPGSHKENNRIRKDFLRFGNRLVDLPNIAGDDQELKFTSIDAPAGSLIIFDTDGFHRGGIPKVGKERRIIRSRCIFANQPAKKPKLFSPQWWWESDCNPLRIFAPKKPKGRRSTGGAARAS